MKTEEDEAFDELARRQGMWGGGFPAKRNMAADKQHWNEDEWRRNNWRCGHGWLRGEQCEICNAAQEPVTTVTSETGNPDVTMSWWHEPPLPVGTPLYTFPPQRPWVGLTDDDKYEFAAAQHSWEDLCLAVEAKLKEKNNGT
jgi:hypothetical protein